MARPITNQHVSSISPLRRLIPQSSPSHSTTLQTIFNTHLPFPASDLYILSSAGSAPALDDKASRIMTCSATKSPPQQIHEPHIQKRPSERKTITKKPRPARKLINPLDILTLVVAGPRRNGKFACPLCPSNFGRRCELKRHVAEVHTVDGACRFACKYPGCDKTFTRKDALTKHHAVKHQGKKRFVCATCSEKFTTRYDLSRHNIRVHSNVKKRFTCEFCSAGFSQKSQLTMHKGRVHSGGNTESCCATRRACMDSLAAAAMAVAAEEEKTERQAVGGSGNERHSGEQVTRMETKCRAEALGAQALLEAAGFFGKAESE